MRICNRSDQPKNLCVTDIKYNIVTAVLPYPEIRATDHYLPKHIATDILASPSAFIGKTKYLNTEPPDGDTSLKAFVGSIGGFSLDSVEPFAVKRCWIHDISSCRIFAIERRIEHGLYRVCPPADMMLHPVQHDENLEKAPSACLPKFTGCPVF